MNYSPLTKHKQAITTWEQFILLATFAIWNVKLQGCLINEINLCYPQTIIIDNLMLLLN
jgi:hypothetical protein